MLTTDNLSICPGVDKSLDNDAGYQRLLKEIFDRLFDYTYSISAGMITYNICHSTKGTIVVCQYINVRPGAFRFILSINSKLYGFVKFHELLDQLIQ